MWVVFSDYTKTEDGRYWTSDVKSPDWEIGLRTWPKGAGYVDKGTALLMCDHFNLRDYGRLNPRSIAGE